MIKFILLFSMMCSSAYCCEKYEILKSIIQQSEITWKAEYEMRHQEVTISSCEEDPTFYHYLWYAKGENNAYSLLMNVINELEQKD